jgi:pimeloyl-ACP methyl ester carboxylesterase
MEPSWTTRSRDDTLIAGYELGGSGEVILIAHATGLCGPMYRSLAEQLAPRFRMVAFDFRGHGASGSAGDYRWDRTAEDINAVAEFLSVGPIHAFGHSMGGASLLLAERNAPSTFASLFLFEPIVFSGTIRSDEQNVMAESARRRRVEFESRADALYRFANKPPFVQIQVCSLAAYVDHGFAQGPNGGVRLKCLPEVEASLFEQGRFSKLEDVEATMAPTVIAVGRDDGDFGPSQLGPPLAAALADGVLVRYGHMGHFGPLQDPWTIARDLGSHIATVAARSTLKEV